MENNRKQYFYTNITLCYFFNKNKVIDIKRNKGIMETSSFLRTLNIFNTYIGRDEKILKKLIAVYI